MSLADIEINRYLSSLGGEIMKLKMKLLLEPLYDEEDEWPAYPCPNCGHAPVPTEITVKCVIALD